ncbi:hypothetical protein TBLA_0I02790 [Henningerozyma blattae CBS 6284]|uniref:HTH La-type RNA-binding domain-containing protein n=1 Tax=Henningerozyma blattae (strain ATCC 34711 / CBS 6284 / DSM 70876 / NBRC 10599 / NRRL Y-10934 / UCD 77-7) TaxID=1071380 RepID=I2H983_HENB6|nr:hypothetical protein TBLA_0I02790 [Tetrapisispora blattae CBS 6284]CCH62935.1 hypothetical protein TBLA_0I02790 [Tetrapisispora blattae CBS 6284]
MLMKERRGSFAPIDFTPDINEKCLRQVEFYFSEYNLPYDKFLRSIAEKNDGWVPITTIATFNRMKRYRPIDKVVEVLKTSTILEVSNDGENIKRLKPLVLDRKDKQEQSSRTLAILNFPHDSDKNIISNENQENQNASELTDNAKLYQEDIENFIKTLSPKNTINQVRLKRDRKRNFNGTVLVEFKHLKNYQNFLTLYDSDIDISSFGNDNGSITINTASCERETLSYKGNKLNIMSKKQYDAQREATKSKNFSGSGQRSRSFTGSRKNLPSKKKLLAAASRAASKSSKTRTIDHLNVASDFNDFFSTTVSSVSSSNISSTSSSPTSHYNNLLTLANENAISSDEDSR